MQSLASRRSKLGAGLLAAAALVLIGYVVWISSQRDVAAPALPPQPQLDGAAQRQLAERMAARVDERPRVDTGQRVPVPSPSEPAPAATVRVRIVDAGSGQAIAGARAYDIQRAQVCATAADDGTLAVPNLSPGRVAFAADGYFAKLP